MRNDQPERSYFERLVALGEEKQRIAEDISEVYAEIREEGATFGIDVKVLRLAVKRALEPDKARVRRLTLEQSADALLAALGHLAGTPLGDSARRAFDDREAQEMRAGTSLNDKIAADFGRRGMPLERNVPLSGGRVVDISIKDENMPAEGAVTAKRAQAGKGAARRRSGKSDHQAEDGAGAQ